MLFCFVLFVLVLVFGYILFEATCEHVFDPLVHEGLREHGLVLLAVPVAPVAHQVQHHVHVELAAELDGDARHRRHRLRVVAVHVQHGRAHALRYV